MRTIAQRRKAISIVLKCFAAMAILLFMGVSAKASIITYALQPGSTITPNNGGKASGPTELLTGTFSWERGSDVCSFHSIYLHFESPSFLLTLNTTDNWLDTSVSVLESNPETYFGEIVDAVGFPTSPLKLGCYSSPGTYEGPHDSPTRLDYPNLVLLPSYGGLYEAHLNFTAIQVPEPASMFLLMTGLIVFAFPRQGRKNR